MLRGTLTSWKMYETKRFFESDALRSMTCALCVARYCILSCCLSANICLSLRSFKKLVPMRKTWNSPTARVSFSRLTHRVPTVRLTVDHVSIKQLWGVALVDQQHSHDNLPLDDSKHGHGAALSEREDGEGGETVPESEKVEKVTSPARIVVDGEEAATVHLPDEDVGHDPRGSDQDCLPDQVVPPREIENDEKGDREDHCLG